MKRKTVVIACRRLAVLLLALIALCRPGPIAAADMNEVRHFTYWLANPDPALIAASDFDLAVVDYSADGSAVRAFGADEVQLMQRRPDGGRRILLAYMSIGEAEDYRFYWQRDWNATPPAWLDEENPDWPGNYKVRYWHPEWQRLIFGSPGAYLDRILEAGFDGVYLDIVDAYWHYQERGRDSAAAEMIAFVADLAAYARGHVPGFLVVPQNAEDLLADAGYRAVIDAQGKEDLYFGWDGEGVPNPSDSVAWMKRHLDMALDAGKPVLLIEYPESRDRIAEAYERGRANGFVPYATVRGLDRMVVNQGFDPPLRGLELRE